MCPATPFIGRTFFTIALASRSIKTPVTLITMSASKRVAFAVTVSWLSKSVTILANLLLMPILFRLLGKEELGLWFLLGNSQAFLGLLGLGIAPTLSRHIALAKGSSGSDPETSLTPESQQHISNLIITGRIIFRWLAAFVFMVAWLSGYFLIKHIALKEITFQEVFISWTILCLGYAIGVWVSYLSCWLEGLGYVGWDSLIVTAVSVGTVAANVIVVLNGGGLLALSIITVVSGLIQRICMLAFIKFRKINFSFGSGMWSETYARKMVKPALYFWLTALGMFLILKTDQYFITVVSGVDEIPAYNAAYQLASNLRNVALPFALSASAFISQMWQAEDFEGVHQIVRKSCNFGLSVMCVGSGYLIIMGKDITDLWLGSGVFAGSAILITFCVMFIFEVQNVCLMYGARATEYEKFAAASLSAGILNLVFTAILIKPLGLIGVALGTLIAQLLTSNWYVVLKSLRRLKIDFYTYSRETFVPAVLTFGISTVFTYGIRQTATSFNDHSFFIVSCTSVACAFLYVATLWMWVLEDRQKAKLTIKIQDLLA